MKLAANISLLFPDLPIIDRVHAAADAGFEGIEILFPYDEDIRALTRALSTHDLPLVLMNAPPPNYTGGARGFAAVPGLEDRFRHDFWRVLRYAGELGTQRIHVMAGEGNGAAARQVFVENLKWATETAGDLPLTIEPLNPVSMPGYFLNDYDLAAGIIDAVDAPNLGLQYDAFHSEMIHGDAVATWDRFKAISTHVQLGSAPGRNEPDTPVFPTLFKRLRDDGYKGWISAEYHPRGETTEGLGWMATARG